MHNHKIAPCCCSNWIPYKALGNVRKSTGACSVRETRAFVHALRGHSRRNGISIGRMIGSQWGGPSLARKRALNGCWCIKNEGEEANQAEGRSPTVHEKWPSGPRNSPTRTGNGPWKGGWAVGVGKQRQAGGGWGSREVVLEEESQSRSSDHHDAAHGNSQGRSISPPIVFLSWLRHTVSPPWYPRYERLHPSLPFFLRPTFHARPFATSRVEQSFSIGIGGQSAEKYRADDHKLCAERKLPYVGCIKN